MYFIDNAETVSNRDFFPLLPSVLDIAHQAGERIAEIYHCGDYKESVKQDATPVTTADIMADQYITQQLQRLTPDIPVLSEEGAHTPLFERSQWPCYWLVDPLDGTQEFITRSGDYATVIALMQDTRPIMGVVYAPIKQIFYYAYHQKGAWKRLVGQAAEKIYTHKYTSCPKLLRLTISHRQSIQKTKAHLNANWRYQFTPMGSAALKACLVAEGQVDSYIRFGPTSEWDTAATQCIVKEAGGQLLDVDMCALTYNQRETFRNPNFIALGDKNVPWSEILLSTK